MEKKWNKRFSAVDVLFAGGAALISLGAALGLCLAAGLAAAGGFCLLASVLWDDGNGGDGA